MSDLMFYGVLRMPYEMAMGDVMSSMQFYSTAQEAADRVERAEAENVELKIALEKAFEDGKRLAHEQACVVTHSLMAERDAVLAALADTGRKNLELTRVHHERGLQIGRLDVALVRALAASQGCSACPKETSYGPAICGKCIEAVCTWTAASDDTGSWDATCGECYIFIDGGPTENNVKFCHGCGKPVQITAAGDGEA